MSQLNKWMIGGKISKLVVVITSKETGEHVERWQFDVQMTGKSAKHRNAKKPQDKENTAPGWVFKGLLVQEKLTMDRDVPQPESEPEKTEAQIQEEIQSIFRQITASVTFLPVLDGNCTFNVLVYADADSDVPIEWGDSDAKEIKDGEKVQLRSFSTMNHKVDTMVSYRLLD
jgi:mitotic spindle assembly checkpoint protein MAD2